MILAPDTLTPQFVTYVLARPKCRTRYIIILVRAVDAMYTYFIRYNLEIDLLVFDVCSQICLPIHPYDILDYLFMELLV